MINVRDVPYLLDLDGTPIKALNNREHLEIEHTDNESSIMTLIYDIEETFITEQQIVYRNNRYIISEIEQQKSSRTTKITAEIAYLELADKNVTINSTDEVLEVIAQKALNGSKWSVGTVEDTTTKHNMNRADVSSLSVLRLLARIADLKLVFDTINFKVHFLNDDANDLGFLFRYRKNLADITKTTFAPKATTLIPFGKGGLTIESVNNGRRYVEDFSWYESLGYTKSEARRLFNKVHTFSDERFVYAGNLMREAERRLRTLAHPQIAYEVSVSHLDKDIKIGDYGYVIDEELGIKVNVKVVRLIEYEDVNDNQIELNYLIPGLADVQETTDTSHYEQTLSTIVVQNESSFVGDSNFKLLLSMTITNYASTHAQLGLVIVGQASTNTLLELYFDIDGRKHDFEVKQVVQPGYNTIALPMLFTQIQEGSHLLNVFLKVNNGTFTIERNNAQMFVQAENLQGGLATTMPRANVVEEVKFPFTRIDVTDILVEIEMGGLIYTDEPPAMPTGVTYTVDLEKNEVKIEWNENTEEFLLGYNVYVNGVKHNDEIILDTEYIVTGLERGNSYSIELKAQSIWGIESEPYVIEVEMPEYEVPSTPTGVTYTIENGAIKLEWNENEEDFVVGYNVYVN